MAKKNTIAKYLKHRKVATARMRTKMSETLASSILYPKIDGNVKIIETNYQNPPLETNECDLIYLLGSENDGGDASNNGGKATSHPSAAKKPVLLFIHGGGWMVGDRKLRRGMLSKYAEDGFFVVNINYRLSPEVTHPEIVEDIFRAVEFTAQIADEYNLDLTRIFFGGDSAGAHLAALSALCLNVKKLKNTLNKPLTLDLKVSGLLLICGIYNFKTVLSCHFKDMRKFLAAYSGMKTRKFVRSDEAKLLSPINYASYFPPTFVVMGDTDKLKPESEQLVCALAENNMRFGLYIGRGLYSFHVFPAAFYAHQSAKCIEKSSRFLSEIK